MDGRVYWITGLSGSGKTTLGNALFYQLKKTSDRVVMLDGNVLKHIVSTGEISYTPEGRKARAHQYAQLCKLLADQGLIVICCTVSLYHEVHRWNRANLPGYVEILMDVDLAVLHRMNYRGLYPDQDAGSQGAEFPEHPDLVIRNEMNNRVSEYVTQVLEITPETVHQTKKFKSYWDEYYKKDLVTSRPSGFAEFIFPYLEKGRLLIDLGCGNGRDSVFFAGSGIKTTAVDLSTAAIDIVSRNGKNLPLFPVCDDFVKSKVLFSIEYDYCYSRWTVHSIDDSQQEELFENVYNALRPGGLFFIEARTIHDDIYGVGENVGPNAYVHNDHYRRFLEMEGFLDSLRGHGFEISHSEEGRGYSRTAESDPALLRVVARKPGIIR